jgi:GT2 family glycosyltransferase
MENPWDSVRLLANGDLVTALRRDFVMGNVDRLPLQEIWRSPAYNAFRHQYQLGTDSVCRLCSRKLAYIPGAIGSVVRPQQGNTIELVEGWHWSEGEIVWSKRGSRCLLGSAHDAGQREGAVRCVEVEGLLPGGSAAAPNELSVWQKERKLGSFCNSFGTIRPFHMLVPFTDASGVVQLEFTTSDVYRPRESGSPDRRDLGFALRSLGSVIPPDHRLPRWRYLPLYVSLQLGRRLAPLFHHAKPALWRLPSWRPGMTIIIPECGTPGLLRHAIASAVAAAARLAEDTEIIVVVNGAALPLYDEHRCEFPMVSWLYSKKALGYCGAVATGLRCARFDWVYLLNSDMTLAEAALAEVARWRFPHVFAVSSQVFFADPGRRREETGWTDCSISEDGKVELFDAAPEDQSTVRGHLYAGGGNSLFRADVLRKFLSRSHCYGPAYWEDVEWGVRAWREGFEVLFCPASHVTHVHRATVSRLFSAQELERIWKRNQLLFSVRNGFSRLPSRRLVRSFRSTLDLITQRELVTLRQAVSLFLALVANARAPAPAADLSRTCRKYYLWPPARCASRPTALVVSPFAVYPKGHGGARRIASLIEQLSRSLDIILLSDEDTEYRLEHIVSACGPVSIHLTGGRPSPSVFALDRVGRIQSHSHDRLRVEMERLALVYNVMLIQIEHVELAGLAGSSKSRAPRVIDLHDVLLSDGPPTEEDRVEQDLIAHHDAVLTCSHEDARLLRHPRIAIVPNGFTRRPLRYRSSRGNRMILFAGPFRFKPNLLGIVAFLERVYPHLLAEVPGLELTILGGRASRYVAAQYPCFEQRGVTMIEQAVEIEPWLERCAVTINPVPETRGSCVKVIESIGFGRVCISTEVGARSFRELGAGSLITVPCVNDFRAPLQRLLLDEDSRIRLERPDDRILSGLTWESVGRGLLDTYQRWFWTDSAKAPYCGTNIE